MIDVMENIKNSPPLWMRKLQAYILPASCFCLVLRIACS
jgi:hypothetical protein